MRTKPGLEKLCKEIIVEVYLRGLNQMVTVEIMNHPYLSIDKPPKESEEAVAE